MDKGLDEMNLILSELLASQAEENGNLSAEAQEDLKEGFAKNLQEIIEVRNSLNVETDRGCVLISASFLDCKLENLLRSYLVEDKDILKSVFLNNGSLGTFSSKIDMSYLLGLISGKMHRDLHLIRKIRNDFGHNYAPISFETSAIKNRCLELYHNAVNLADSPRGNFTRVVCGVLGIINGKNISVRHVNSKEDIEITEEVRESNIKLIESILNKTSHDDLINK